MLTLVKIAAIIAATGAGAFLIGAAFAKAGERKWWRSLPRTDTTPMLDDAAYLIGSGNSTSHHHASCADSSTTSDCGSDGSGGGDGGGGGGD